MQTTQALLGLAAIYVIHLYLDKEAGPCRVVRRSGVTILAIDPRASCLDVFAFNVDYLTVPERNALRVAHGEPKVGEGPVSDAWIDGPGYYELPESLRLPIPVPAAY